MRSWKTLANTLYKQDLRGKSSIKLRLSKDVFLLLIWEVYRAYCVKISARIVKIVSFQSNFC